jgi:hypothetical protein
VPIGKTLPIGETFSCFAPFILSPRSTRNHLRDFSWQRRNRLPDQNECRGATVRRTDGRFGAAPTARIASEVTMKNVLPKRLVRTDMLIAALCGLVLALGGLWSWNRLVPRWGIPGFEASGRVSFSPDERDAARRQVRDSLASLEAFLGYGANGAGWRSHLRLNDLRTQLASAPDAADRKVLKDVLDLFSENHSGLELPEFASVRSALSTYVKVLSLPAKSA